MKKKPSPALLPPDRIESKVSKFSNNPLRKPATRGDLMQITKAMMKTWRAVDEEFEYNARIHDYLFELSSWLALPWYRRMFVEGPVFPLRTDDAIVETEQGREVTTIAPQDDSLDHSEVVGDISTAVAGEDSDPDPET